MKINKLKISAVIALGLYLGACAQDTVGSSMIAPTRGSSTQQGSSDGELNNNINRRYQLSYDQETSNLSMTANFKMRGTWFTTVRLDEPSSISVNGSRMTLNEGLSKEAAVTLGMYFPLFAPFLWAATGVSYHINLGSGEYATQSVSWTDQVGRKFDDSLKIFPIRSVSASPSIDTQSGFTISVSSDGAGHSQSFGAVIIQRLPDGTSVSASATASAGEIYFSPESLNQLKPGPASFKVERTVRVGLNSQGSGSASAEVIYRTQSHNVWISQ